ncbi:hypothetical protein VUR80DRAFT_3915 [Thermomyces stellatus]
MRHHDRLNASRHAEGSQQHEVVGEQTIPVACSTPATTTTSNWQARYVISLISLWLLARLMNTRPVDDGELVASDVSVVGRARYFFRVAERSIRGFPIFVDKHSRRHRLEAWPSASPAESLGRCSAAGYYIERPLTCDTNSGARQWQCAVPNTPRFEKWTSPQKRSSWKFRQRARTWSGPNGGPLPTC